MKNHIKKAFEKYWKRQFNEATLDREGDNYANAYSAFYEGYKYRKTLELMHAYRSKDFPEILKAEFDDKNLLRVKTSEVYLDQKLKKDNIQFILDEAKHITPEKWDEIHKAIWDNQRTVTVDKEWLESQKHKWDSPATFMNMTMGVFPNKAE